MATVLIVVFFISLFLGLPVFLTMCIAVVFAFVESGGIALTMLPQQIFAGINSFPVMAIPLFILASDLMTEGKLTDMLISFCNDYLGRITGGLGHVNVALSMLFGGISGSAVADAAGPSKIVMFMMRGAGYDRYYSGAITAASSVIGIIIPPSIPMVIYSLSDGKTSTMGLFAAGYIPGIIVGLSLMILNRIMSKRHGYRYSTDKIHWIQKLKSLWHAMPGLIMPIIIIVCTVGGVTTPTEAGAIAVAYALIVGFVITRKLTFQRLAKVTVHSAIVSSSVMMIVAMGYLFSWVLTYARIPQQAATFVGTLTDNPTIMLFLISLLVIVTGMFVDTIPAIMILAPIVSSIGVTYGINPFQTGVVVVVGIGIGMLTPPVAPLLFITSTIGRLRLEKLIVASLPFMLVELIVLILLILVPPLTTWLPAVLGYGGL